MNNEILKHYFTDHQLAAILGITLGGLRNKIYRGRLEDLPKSTQVMSRWRLWHKEETKTWLLARFNSDVEMVKNLLKVGEDTDSGATPTKKRARKKQR